MCLNHSLVKRPSWHSLSCDSQLSPVLWNPWDKSWSKSPSPELALLMPLETGINKVESQGVTGRRRTSWGPSLNIYVAWHKPVNPSGSHVETWVDKMSANGRQIKKLMVHLRKYSTTFWKNEAGRSLCFDRFMICCLKKVFTSVTFYFLEVIKICIWTKNVEKYAPNHCWYLILRGEIMEDFCLLEQAFL